MTIAYLGVGSNLGNRKANIAMAANYIRALKNTRLVKQSRLLETSPCGGPLGQPKYLNAAFKIRTSLTPLKLLKNLKSIEKMMGRVKTVRNGPRVIDLDILLYGDKTLRSRQLTLPHPRMFRREFVIRPLMEIL